MGEICSSDDEWGVQRFFYSYSRKNGGVEWISNKLSFLGNKIDYEKCHPCTCPHTTPPDGVEALPKELIIAPYFFPVSSVKWPPYLGAFLTNASESVTCVHDFRVLDFLNQSPSSVDKRWWIGKELVLAYEVWLWSSWNDFTVRFKGNLVNLAYHWKYWSG
jgi:hypothetical protein